MYFDHATVNVPRRILLTATTKCSKTLNASSTFKLNCIENYEASGLLNAAA